MKEKKKVNRKKAIKETIKTALFVFMFLLFLLVTIAFLIKVNIDNHIHTRPTKQYTMTTKVIKVDKPTDTVTIQDFNGNLWQFKGVKDWEEGAICSCIMDNNGTDSIKDDKIISTHYDGWFEAWGDFF